MKGTTVASNVHDPVAALPAPDRVPGSDLVLAVTLSANVDHRSLDRGRLLIAVPFDLGPGILSLTERYFYFAKFESLKNKLLRITI